VNALIENFASWTWTYLAQNRSLQDLTNIRENHPAFHIRETLSTVTVGAKIM
jgi:hypothetical protein